MDLRGILSRDGLPVLIIHFEFGKSILIEYCFLYSDGWLLAAHIGEMASPKTSLFLRDPYPYLLFLLHIAVREFGTLKEI